MKIPLIQPLHFRLQHHKLYERHSEIDASYKLVTRRFSNHPGRAKAESNGHPRCLHPQGLTWADGQHDQEREAAWEGARPLLQEDGRGDA